MFSEFFQAIIRPRAPGRTGLDIANIRIVGQPRDYYLKPPAKGASLIRQIGGTSQGSEICSAELTGDKQKLRGFGPWKDKNNTLYEIIPQELNGALFQQVAEALKQGPPVPLEQFEIVFQVMDVVSTHMVTTQTYYRVVPELGYLTSYIRHAGYFIAYLNDLNQPPTQPILENVSHIIARTEEVIEKFDKNDEENQKLVAQINKRLGIFKAWCKKYGVELPQPSEIEARPPPTTPPTQTSPPEVATNTPNTIAQPTTPLPDAVGQVRQALASANQAADTTLRKAWQEVRTASQSSRAAAERITVRVKPPETHPAERRQKKRRRAKFPADTGFTPILPPEAAWRPGRPRRTPEQEKFERKDLLKEFEKTGGTLDLGKTPARKTLEGYLKPSQRTKFHMAIITSALARCFINEIKIPFDVATHLNAIYRISDRPDMVDAHGQINRERLTAMAREYMQLGSGPIIDQVKIVSKKDIPMPKLDQKALDQIEAIRQQMSAVEESLEDLRNHTGELTPGERMIENIRNLFTPDQIVTIFRSGDDLNELLDDWGTLSPAEQSTLINIAKKLDQNRDPKIIEKYPPGLNYGVAFSQASSQLSTQKSGIVSFFTVADHPGKIDRYAEDKVMRSDKELYTLAIIPVMTELAEAFPEFNTFLPILQEKLEGESNFYQAFIEAKNDYTHNNSDRTNWERMTHIAHSGLFLQTLTIGSRHFAYQHDTTDPDGVKRILADGVYPVPVYAAFRKRQTDVRTLTRYDLTAYERLINQLVGGKGALVGANGSGKSVRVASELAIYLGIPVFVEEDDASAVKINCGDPVISTNMMAQQEKPWSTGQSSISRLVKAMIDRIVVSDEPGSGLPHNAQLSCSVLLALHTYGRQILHDGPSFARAVMTISQEIYDRMDFQAMTDNYQAKEGLVESSEGMGVAVACIPSIQYQEDLQTKYRAIFGTNIRGLNVYLQIAQFLEKIEKDKKVIEFQPTENLRAAGFSDTEPDGKASLINQRLNGMMAESAGKGPFGKSASLMTQTRQPGLISFITDPKITSGKAAARGKIISTCMSEREDLDAYRMAALTYDTVTEDYAHAAALITDLTDNTPARRVLDGFISAMESSGYFQPATLARLKALPKLLDMAGKIGSKRVRECVNFQTVRNQLLETLRSNYKNLYDRANPPRKLDLLDQEKQLEVQLASLQREVPDDQESRVTLESVFTTDIAPEKKHEIWALIQGDLINIESTSLYASADDYLPSVTQVFKLLGSDAVTMQTMEKVYGAGMVEIVGHLNFGQNPNFKYIRNTPSRLNPSVLASLTQREKAWLLGATAMTLNAKASDSTVTINRRHWADPSLGTQIAVDKGLDRIYVHVVTKSPPSDLTVTQRAVSAKQSELTNLRSGGEYIRQRTESQKDDAARAKIGQLSAEEIAISIKEMTKKHPEILKFPNVRSLVDESKQMAVICSAINEADFWTQLSGAVSGMGNNPTFGQLVKIASHRDDPYSGLLQKLVTSGVANDLGIASLRNDAAKIAEELNELAGILTYAQTLRQSGVCCRAEFTDDAGVEITEGINLATAVMNTADAKGTETANFLTGINSFIPVTVMLGPGCNIITAPVGSGKSTTLDMITLIEGLAHANDGWVPAKKCTLGKLNAARSLAIRDTTSTISRFTFNMEGLADLSIWIAALPEGSKPLIILDEPALGTDAAGRRIIVTTLIENISRRCPDALIVLVTHESGIVDDLVKSFPGINMFGINPATKAVEKSVGFNESDPFDPKYVRAAVTHKLLSRGIPLAVIKKHLPVILREASLTYAFISHLDDLQHAKENPAAKLLPVN